MNLCDKERDKETEREQDTIEESMLNINWHTQKYQWSFLFLEKKMYP